MLAKAFVGGCAGLLFSAVAACAHEVPQGGAAACPAASFPKFADIFVADVTVQKAHTRFPLSTSRLVDGGDEPRPMRRLISKEQASFPLIMPKAEQQRRDVEMIVSQSPAEGASITLRGRNSDIRVTYRFSGHRCWDLISVEDISL